MSTVKRSRADTLFVAVNFVILALVAIVVAYPIIYVLSASFSDPIAITEGRVFLLPVGVTLENYKLVFGYGQLWRGYLNSLFYTVAGTALNLILTMLMAFSLSEKNLPLKKLFMGLLTFTMLFSGGLIPSYLLMKNLGLIDTVWVLIIPGGVAVYNVIVSRTFMESNVPQELREATQIDGCSDARYFFSILLPLSQAVISVISLYYAVAHWNSYFSALIYIRDKQLQPLQLILRSILLSTRVSLNEFEDPDLLEGKIGLEFLVKFALIVVSSAPIMCLYPFVQKFFAKGVMLGSVKG